MSERNEPAGPDQTETGRAGRPTPDAPQHHHPVLRHTLRVLASIALVLYFIVVAVLVGLRYIVLPHVDALRPRIEAVVSSRLHAELRIGKLAPHWLGFNPGIDVTDLTIRDRHGNIALNVPHATATVSWRSLVTFEPLLSSMLVDKPDVLIARESDGTLTVAGVPVPTTHQGNNATFSTWLMRQEAIVLRGGTLRWHDATRDVPDLALHDIRLAILNDGYDHRVALQAPRDGSVLQGPLDFRAHFRHARFTQAGAPVDWSGNVYLATGPVDLPTLSRYVHFPIPTYAGRVDNTIWAHFAAGHMVSATGVVNGSNVVLQVRPSQPRLSLPVSHFKWRLGIDAPGDYTLQLRDLRAELGQPPLPDGTPLLRTLALSWLDARFRQQSLQQGQLLSVSGDRIDLGILAEFLRALPLPPRALDALVRFDPRGLVANYELGLERAKPEAGEAAAEGRTPVDTAVTHYHFTGDLQGISVAAQEPGPGLTPRGHPRAGLPGVENLWGHIDSDEKHGSLSLDTARAAVTLPGVFDNPRLTFDRLFGALTWTVADARKPGDTHKAFAIDVSQLGVVNADADATMTARYVNPGHGRGSLDLKAKFARAQVKAIARYLPTGLPENTRTYLGHSLQAGVSRGGTIEIHGDLTQFPYTRAPDAGQFRIVAPFSGGRFDPTPYPPRRLRGGSPNVWPAFDDIDGVFTLQQNKLRFDIAHGRYRNFALRNVTGRIDDLGTHGSNLVITGTGRGPLADLLDYANRSSLGYMSKHAAQRVRAQGPATLALTLTIPRLPHPQVRAQGSIGFENNQISADNVPPLSNVTGRVRFANHSAQVDRLTARFLGGDVHASGALRENGSYAFGVSGDVAVDAARGLNLRGTAAAMLGRLSGEAPYSLSVRGALGHLPDVEASADLTDLALDLPAPFGKPAGEPMPLRADLLPGTGDERDDEDPADFQHADVAIGPLAARYVLRRQPGHIPDVVRGVIAMNRPADLPSEGVTAAIDMPAFDADAWHQVVQQIRGTAAASGPGASVATPGNAAAASAPVAASAPMTSSAATTAATAVPAPVSADARVSTALSAATPAPIAAPITAPTTSTAAPASSQEFMPGNPLAQFLPSRFAVHVGMLTLLKRHWENVVVGATRTGRDWQANVASNQVSGHLSWQPGPVPGTPGTLQARLARLVVPAATENDLLGQALSQPVQNMPAIDLIVDQLIVRDHDFGRLQVNAHNFDENGVPVWQLDALDLTNPAAHLNATANWRATGDVGTGEDNGLPRRTSVDFHLDIKNAGALLERAGMPRTLKNGAGTLAGAMTWEGGPTKIDYPTLNGQLAVDLRHGQILRIDPGVAKLLGVLSLQSIARFATLNFRDVIGEGLPFSRVSGTAQIANGIGHTDDFRIITAPGRALMQGTVDLAHETQDLHVHITPTLSAGAGVIAAAVVNPFLGLGALIADFALSHTVESTFALDYRITGPWSKPQVERLHRDQGKINAPVPTPAPAPAY